MIISPKTHQSGVSTKLSMGVNITYEQYQYPLYDDKYISGYIIGGSPADCTRFGIKMFKPDLTLSGINYGVNIGMDTHYSGTLGACKDSMFQHVPAIGLSTNIGQNEQYQQIYNRLKQTIFQVFQTFTLDILHKYLQQHLLLNVNFPDTEIKGLVQARLVDQVVFDSQLQINEGYFKYKGFIYYGDESDQIDQQSDFYYINRGYATYTLISLNGTEYQDDNDIQQKQQIK